MKFQKGISNYGSGSFIWYNLVLTAAHNTYDVVENKEVMEMVFLPGLAGRLSNYIQVVGWHYPKEFKEAKTK